MILGVSVTPPSIITDMGISMEFECVYHGVDGLDVAYQGALPRNALTSLQWAYAKANNQRRPELVEFAGAPFLLLPSGRRGGYRYTLDGGPTGALFWFKDNDDAEQWNIFASMTSGGLLSLGYEGARTYLEDCLRAMEATVTTDAPNRIDYAFDMKTRGFELDLDCIVAHQQAQIVPYHGLACFEDLSEPSVVMRGRRIESVRIAKLPGDQVAIYDKRLDCARKKKEYWYDAWDLDPEDRDYQVWRVELRSGKHGVARKRGIRTLDALEAHAPELLSQLSTRTRYTLPHSGDRNVSRRDLHPLWLAVVDQLPERITDAQGQLPAATIRESERARLEAIHSQQILGNAAGYAATLGLPIQSIREDLPDLITSLLREAVETDDGLKKLLATAKRVEDRLSL